MTSLHRMFVAFGLIGLGIFALASFSSLIGSRSSDVPPRSALIRYDEAKLSQHPRGPLPLTKPQTWILSSDYPKQAIHDELEGTAGFRVKIDPYGEVFDCEIIKSSGWKTFDQKVCATVSTRARFHPALDEDQQPVRSTYVSRVTWRMAD